MKKQYPESRRTIVGKTAKCPQAQQPRAGKAVP
jgi:hypothetical protein